MGFVSVTGGLSGVELAVLAVLVLLCAAAAWRFWMQWSGRTKSDVSGLHFRNRAK
jgi:hypothetical protein